MGDVPEQAPFCSDLFFSSYYILCLVTFTPPPHLALRDSKKLIGIFGHLELVGSLGMKFLLG